MQRGALIGLGLILGMHCPPWSMAQAGHLPFSNKDPIMAAIEAGHRLFLLRREDGYYYPVAVPRNEILESLPAQIDIAVLHSGAVVRVRLPDLIPFDAAHVEQSTVEVYEKGAWHPVGPAVLVPAGILAPRDKTPPIWHSFPVNGVRLKIQSAETKG